MAELGLQLLPERRKKISVYVPGENRLLFISGGFLSLIVLAFAAKLFYKNSIVESVQAADQKLADLEQKRDRDTEEKLILLDRRLKIANALMNDHVYWSAAFSRIQGLIQPQFQFKNFSANIREKKFVFKAEAGSYNIVASQIAAFLNDKDISKVALDKVIALPSGRLEVNMTIHFNTEKLLKNETIQSAPQS